MIAPTPSDPVTHHGLANAIDRVGANIARRAVSERLAERGHVPGARALERLEANAARIEAKRSGKTGSDKTPEPIEPAPTPAPSPIEPIAVSPTEPWSTGRFEIIA